ncbi:hypothetical protein BN14_09528 [Rhizoctonia solani AG-1 IB]|uniref:F-box domain-containing protein n=1 Tax=Thanatephorus cucumeris (strain AG1-IB / isolate 7/3/14) TaxID=1108050 RepID=M5C8M3_THACB|nr:hypothetical protein BN14_09528 [Rhizoctonia solani AG-1 IB]
MVEAARKRLNPSDAGYPKRIEELARIEQSAREAEARRRAHVDPLRKLPLELLVDICRLVVQDTDLEHPRGAAHFAVTLGSVCKSLREMVHSVPWFWQSLSISERHFTKKGAFWLDRLSGQGLYSLSLVDLSSGMAPKLWKFIEAARPDSWKHLSIIGMDAFGYDILDAMRHQHLRLHSLSFRPGTPPNYVNHSNVETCDPDKIIPLFSPLSVSDPSSTRKLTLHVGTMSMSCATLPHITHLDLSFNKLVSSQLEPLFYFLRTVPNLRSLIVRPANVLVNSQHPDLPPLPDFKDLPVLRLENLEELRISTIGPLQSLTTLVFPKLQVLDLQQLTLAKPAIILRYLTECDPSDRPPLRVLRLCRVGMHPPLLLSFLTTFNESLEALEVSYCSALPPNLFSMVVFPKLRDVNFSGTDEVRASELIKMVKNGRGNIRNIIVDGCPGVDSETLPWLRANVSGGVSCVYRTRGEAKARRRDMFL